MIFDEKTNSHWKIDFNKQTSDAIKEHYRNKCKDKLMNNENSFEWLKAQIEDFANKNTSEIEMLLISESDFKAFCEYMSKNLSLYERQLLEPARSCISLYGIKVYSCSSMKPGQKPFPIKKEEYKALSQLLIKPKN